MGSLNGLPALPMYAAGFGVQTPFATLLPPGSKVAAYVRGTAGTLLSPANEDPFVAKNTVATLATAVSRVRAGFGDTIVCLPGHTENFAVADAVPNLVAGTRIIGVGHGGLRPTFRWTATAATLLLNVADVFLSGLRLRMEGANGVVAPVTVSAADNTLYDCDIETSSGASNLATTPITVATGAHRFAFIGNRMRGVAAGVCTDGISVTGAVDDTQFIGNFLFFASGTATGLIRVSADALRMNFDQNRLYNLTASSVNTIVFNSAGITAIFNDNRSAVLTNGTPPAGGILITAASFAAGCENYTVDATATNGFIDPVVST
jgi:hypothetical protein